ncbi:MAG: ABC transporter transmembrane domain-containing protein, partial [Betaproteobacteria bacterium]|nr:ABC transporter transmembrane domain-containing protein [Betaproteobacteria bacterium]
MIVVKEKGGRELYARLLGYVRPHARIFGLAVLGMMAAAATDPLLPMLMKPLLDHGFGAAAGSPGLPPLAVAAAIVGVFVLRGLFNFSSNYGMAWVASRVVLDLRAAMFARLVRLPTRFFDEFSAGALLSKVAYDVMGVTGAATGVLTVLVKDSITVAGLLGWLLYLNWKLTLIALTAGPLVVLAVRLASKRLRNMARGVQHAMGDLAHVLEETIECHKVVKIFGGQDYEAARFAKVAQAVRRFQMRTTVPEAATVPVTQILAAIAVAIIVYIALGQSASSHTTVGEFASFLAALLMLLSPLKRLTDVNAQLQRGLAAAESVFGMIDTPVEEDRGTQVLGRARGEIVYEDVRLTYPTREAPALDGISLAIPPGETIALVGGSGGGKTTLVNLLPRFYAPTGGRILLDGHDIQNLTLESLRANIALVSQDVVLFNDTIRANIAYGRMGGASEQEILAAAEAAQAMDFIRAMPQGLDTEIGESGARLSGGQRQRLAIARA